MNLGIPLYLLFFSFVRLEGKARYPLVAYCLSLNTSLVNMATKAAAKAATGKAAAPAPKAIAAPALNGAMETCCVPLCGKQGVVGQGLVLLKASDDIRGQVRQVKCNECNAGDGRIKRFCKKDDSFSKMYSGLGKDAKQEFRLKVAAEGLLDEKLKNVLIETHIWQKIKKASTNFSAQGEFLSEAQLNDDKTIPRDDKIAIIQNSHSITCQVTGKQLYWKPTYSLSQSRVEEEFESHKKEIEAEEKMKFPKQPALKKQRVLQAADGSVPVVPVTEPQLKRIGGSLKKIDDLKLDLTNMLTDATNTKFTTYISQPVVQKAQDSVAAIDKLAGILKAFQETKRANKGANTLIDSGHIYMWAHKFVPPPAPKKESS